MARLFFSIDPAPPFRLDLTAWAIRRRPENAFDLWDGETYQRLLTIHNKPVLTSVRQSGTLNSPHLHIALRAAARLPKNAKDIATGMLDRLLGLHVNLRAFYNVAAQHHGLHELASRFRGLKPPRFPTVWEGLVNGIACQQFSLTVGIILLNRLAALSGLDFEPDANQCRLLGTCCHAGTRATPFGSHFCLTC